MAWMLGVALALAFGVLLRLWNIGSESLWFDEGYSAWVSGLDISHIIHVIRHDVSPPLYYLLLAGWRSVFGDSEVALRMMSAAAAFIGLILMALTAWEMTRSRTGTVAAIILFAASVLQVQYAQEARSYGLASMLALLALYALVRRTRSNAIWLIVATFALAAAVYLHNMMWFYVAAIDIAYLLMPASAASLTRTRRRIGEVAAINAVIIFLYIPWIPALRGQIQWLNNNFWANVPSAGDLAQVLLAAAGTKMMHLSALLPALPAAWVFASVVCILTVLSLFCRDDRRWALALLIIGLLPILAVFLYAHLRQSFFVEKVFTASTITLPLLGALVVARWRIAGLALCALILTANIIAVWGYFRWEHKEDWRDAVAYVNTLPRESTLVVFVANEGELLYDYYTERAGDFAHHVAGAPQGFFDIEPQKTIQRVLDKPDTAKLASLIDETQPRRIVLVLSHTHFSDPKGLTREMVASRMRRASEARFNLIEVVEYER